MVQGLVSFQGMDSDYKPGLVVDSKKRIITIFDHFRNNHARYEGKAKEKSVKLNAKRRHKFI
jgi:hypothetical protein